MATTEHTINDALAGLLRNTRYAWRNTEIVGSEQLGMLKDSAARPDILILEPHVAPVAVEVEILPAINVEQETIERLGNYVRGSGRVILSAVAVRLQPEIRSKAGKALKAELESSTEFEMAFFAGSSPTDYSRWPRSGWISGGINDLSTLVQLASIPPAMVDEAAAHLVDGVTNAANLIGEMARNHEGAIKRISEALRQEDGIQTRRMAATILVNAFVFHEIVAGGADELAEIRSIEELRAHAGELTKSAILTEWRAILEVDYWPIFDIARRILESVPTTDSKALLEVLATTAERLLQNRLMRSHDLTGAVFQQLIADRQFLAAYYTTPASAALLVGLAITRDTLPAMGRSWASADDVKSLRIADFACGTGTLLSSAYHRISQLHETAGGDSEAIHPEMMASTLLGCDVLPAAAHLTASMLSGAHPTVRYQQSSIMTVAYGKQSDGSVALGSLDLLDPQGVFEVLSITARAIESLGESERETWRALPHASFDLVIMNPPFTRATAHEGKTATVPNPVFAAFGSSAEEQRLMSQATKRLTRGTSAHGNAGEASIFLVLAHRKLKQNGILAMVMPLSLMAGKSWENSRELLAKNYSDLVLVSIAGHGSSEMAFSADTGMAECLVVGRKLESGSSRATFVVLSERPAYPLVGTIAAEQIRRQIAVAGVRRLEDGPIGGTPLYFGDELIGRLLDAPLPISGGWNLARISDFSLAQTAYQIANNEKLWLPTMSKSDSIGIPIASVADVAEVGPIHRDINGKTPTGGIRGPFDIVDVAPGRAPSYPSLWAHDAKRERRMLFDGDSEGIPRRGTNDEEQAILAQKVASIWDTASHCHFNCDFQFNSQSTSMQLTPRKTIGGRAWLSIRLASVDMEKVLVLWANTTLGLLLRWWHSNRQQAGRGVIGKSSLKTMPILNVTSLAPRQIEEAVRLFDELCANSLLPLHRMDEDLNRKELDTRFANTVLGLGESFTSNGGPMDVLRMKLSREPSVRGKK